MSTTLQQKKDKLAALNARIDRLEMEQPEGSELAMSCSEAFHLRKQIAEEEARNRQQSLATEGYTFEAKSGWLARVDWCNLQGYFLFPADPILWLLDRLEEAGEYNCAHLNLDCITKLTASQWERASKFLQTLPANPTPHAD